VNLNKVEAVGSGDFVHDVGDASLREGRAVVMASRLLGA
jgi:hypothetical protein